MTTLTVEYNKKGLCLKSEVSPGRLSALEDAMKIVGLPEFFTPAILKMRFIMCDRMKQIAQHFGINPTYIAFYKFLAG